MANATEFELHELGQETVSGASSSVDVGENRTAGRFKVSMVAFSGTGSAKITVETSDDDTHWRATGVPSPAVNNPTDYSVEDIGRYLRVTWVLNAGATAVTFAVSVEAHQIYANSTDLCSAEIPEKAIASVPSTVKVKALIDASCDAEDALAASNALPLTQWPSSLTRRVSAVAIFYIMKHRGFQPTGSDELIVKGYDDAMKWLSEVGSGKKRPPGLSPTTRLGPQSSSGNPEAPTAYKRRFSDDFGSF